MSATGRMVSVSVEASWPSPSSMVHKLLHGNFSSELRKQIDKDHFKQILNSPLCRLAGNSLSAILDGKARLLFLSRDEEYVITMPYAHCKGNVSVKNALDSLFKS